MVTATPEILSRERLAGYDPKVLARTVIAVVGCGAAGSNIVQTLALSGVGELRLIDFDHIEPSNLTRSPLFPKDCLASRRRRWKARELARAALHLSYAPNPVVRYAVAPVQALGLGAFDGCAAVVSAVDSQAVRAYLADASRLLGIPLIEIGFAAPRGHMSVYPNRTGSEPCWRCLHPEVSTERASCAAYAADVVSFGGIAATQSVAAFLSAVVAEAALLAGHGEVPLGGHAWFLDVRSGTSRLLTLTADQECPGAHRRLDAIHVLRAGSGDLVRSIFDELGLRDAELLLPSPFVRHLPCAVCGRRVEINVPEYRLDRTPRCSTCPSGRPEEVSEPLRIARVRPSDPVASWPCRRLGLCAASVVEVFSEGTGELKAVRLAGDIEELFTTLRRSDVTEAPSPE